MMRIRVLCESQDSEAVVDLLGAEPGVAHLTVAGGVGKQPTGDLIEAAIAREVVERVLHRLTEHGVHHRGEITLDQIDTMVSETAEAAEQAVPGAGAEAVIWDELIDTTGEESQLNPVFLAFLTIACLLATVGVLTDSAITIVGAMVVSPDFGPLAALAVALAVRRRGLAARAGLALGVGFPLAMLVTAAFAWLGRRAGLFGPADLTGLHEVSFIYQVGPYSVVVALLAGVAGMLALTSAKPGALVGVFISVTTVPAAGFAVLAAVTEDWRRCGGSVLQLLVNLVGVAVAGGLTLLVCRGRVPGPGRMLREHRPSRR
ncbi:DUF389 domain-containing protein [Streptomyces sp. NPDC007025]|uniref:DUF389 domain-containing protein n=1 Tax=Streptomyces sp. NPDC007025 TaxID=3364771 RepID=UPI0036859D92